VTRAHVSQGVTRWGSRQDWGAKSLALDYVERLNRSPVRKVPQVGKDRIGSPGRLPRPWAALGAGQEWDPLCSGGPPAVRDR
jgi:hypothetical protein